MKSLFTRLRGTQTPPLPQPVSSVASFTDKDEAPSSSQHSRLAKTNRKKSSTNSLKLIPLHSPTTQHAVHPQSSYSSSDSIHPLSAQDAEYDSMPESQTWWRHEEEERATATGFAGDGMGKKVTFRSPVPTPPMSVIFDQGPQHLHAIMENDHERINDMVESKHSVQGSFRKKFSATAKLVQPHPPSLSSTTQAVPSSRSRSIDRQSVPVLARKPSLPHPRNHSSSLASAISASKSSVPSPTPSDALAGASSARSYLPPPNSWSEMAGKELIANIGPKERTRQEVLWEIVSSEER